MTSQPADGHGVPETVPNGLVVVDKPAGWTSHQVIGRVRRVLGLRKVGHAGTLDPMATGVLLVGVGRATRLLGHLMLTEKTYLATMRLGVATSTDDAEGEITAAPGCRADAAAIESELARFVGEIQQVPSAVSAIKVNGQRAYARVRAGEQVDLAARPVTVHEIETLRIQTALLGDTHCVDVAVRVRCSSGTYIRALARDLGQALGSAGHLTALRRTRVGPFGLDQAQPVGADIDALSVLGIDAVAAECFAVARLAEDQATEVQHGRRLVGFDLAASPSAMMDTEGRFLALYKQSGRDAIAEAVFAPASGGGL